MTRYWVIGGEYADTALRKLAAGKTEERIGPFNSYAAAKAAWQARAWATVDSANTRYRIVKKEGSRKRSEAKPTRSKPAKGKPAKSKSAKAKK